jgi:hypothetical protein
MTKATPSIGPGHKGADWRQALASKHDFIGAVHSAVEQAVGFAAGKIGHSEQQLLLLALRQSQPMGLLQQRALALSLETIARDSAGIFPASLELCLQYADFFAAQIQAFDYVGWFLDEAVAGVEDQLMAAHRWTGKPIFYRHQEPDRSIPDDPQQCYLDSFRGKRLLIVCTFAELLRARATRATFEAVWSKTGKHWFEPSCVEAVEFPWGWAPETWKRFATVFDLIADIERRIEAKDFDVALIGAGGMSIPLAAFVKRLGKTAIALGGHLQALFGVLGRRWRDDPEWRRCYLNDSWIDLPACYVPENPQLCGGGEYW